MGIIVRNDDVNPNTNIAELMEMYRIIEEAVPNVEIWTVWCPICKRTPSVKPTAHLYPAEDLPIKEKSIEYFYTHSSRIGLPVPIANYRKVCSHGMMHFCHKDMPYEMQEMSIVTSCTLLRTNIFVPPFSEYDANTEAVCKKFGITLTKREEWLSLDYNKFDPLHDKWYFHSWRYTPETLKEKLRGISKS